MKKLIIVLIVFFNLNIYSQEYLPTALEDSRRVVAFFSVSMSGVNIIVEMISQWEYKCSGDTIINDTIYKKVYKRNLKTNTYPYEPISEYQLVRYIRDDIEQKKVYQRFLSSNTESLLFDFSLEIGDYVQLPITEADVDLVIDAGSNSFYFELEYYYMEGKGSNCGFLEPMLILPSKKNELDAEYTNLEKYCVDEDCESIFVNTIEITSSTKETIIFPQPAVNFVKFTFESSESLKIQIYNLRGELIDELIGESNIQWDCGNVGSGVYLYRAELNSSDNNREVFRGKLIIK